MSHPADATGGRAPVLSVRGLSVRFLMPGGHRVAAVTDAHFDVAAGECLALIGESGCGKSVLASALLGLLPGNARTAGEALLFAGAGAGRGAGAGKGAGAGTGAGAGRAPATAPVTLGAPVTAPVTAAVPVPVPATGPVPAAWTCSPPTSGPSPGPCAAG